MIALIARRSLTYDGRTVRAGERFDASPLDAAVLTYHRQAVFAPRRQASRPLTLSDQIRRAVDAGVLVPAPDEAVLPLDERVRELVDAHKPTRQSRRRKAAEEGEA